VCQNGGMKQVQSPTFIGFLVVASLSVNAGLSWINESLELPFFMDSIGTSVAAVILPFWPALFVALATNFTMELVLGLTGYAWPFFICSLATFAIIRGFMSADRFHTVGDALLVSLLVAIANAILGGIVAAFVFGGLTTVGLDYLVTGLVSAGQSLLTAAFWARVPVNLIDKTVAIFIAFFLAAPLARWSRRLSLRRE
jgi:energy-coupling factor transport system substrate-specific component